MTLQTTPPPLMCVADAARYLGVSKSFLNQGRRKGHGPAYVKLGRRVLYARADLEAHIEAARQPAATGAAHG